MKIIGLTGPSGSGKGTLALEFGKFNIPSVDADEVYHSLITPPSRCLDEICHEFGKGVLAPDGSLDRRALANIVFGSEEKRLRLNRITHRHVIARMEEIFADYEMNGTKAVIADVPLLFESGFDKKCDYTIAIIADKKTRLERIRLRDGISQSAAEARLAAQPDDSFYIENADRVIFNNGSCDDLAKLAEEILSEVAQL